MNKLRVILPDLLVDLHYGLLFCGLSIIPVLAVYFPSTAGALWGLALLSAALLFFALRRICRFFVLFTAAHLLVLAAVPYLLYVVTGSLLPALGALGCLLMLTVYSFTRRLAKESAGLTLPLLLATALFYIVAAIIMDRAFGISLYLPYTVFTGLSFLLFAAYTQVVNIAETLTEAYAQSAQYAGAIFRFNNRSTALFLLLSAVVMGGMVLLPVSDLLWALLRVLQRGLRMLFGMLPEGEPETPDIPVDEVGPAGGFDLSGLVPGEQPREPLIPPEVLQAVVFTFLLLLLIFGIVLFLYRMYRRFGEETDTSGDIKEYVEPTELQLTEQARRGFRRLVERIVGPENKIRRLFYHKVRDYHKKKKQSVLPSETAAEIARRMAAQDETIGGLRKEYEAVRYGADEKSPAKAKR